MHTNADFVIKKYSNIVKYYNRKITFNYFIIFSNVIYSCDGKAE